MSRVARKLHAEELIRGYVEQFRKRMRADLAYDIRAAIDREKDARKRGAMLAAEREVYRQFRVAHGDHPGGFLDCNGIELDEPEKGHCFDEMWGIK